MEESIGLKRVKVGFENNSEIIFSNSLIKTCIGTPHQSSLGKTILLRGCNVCFYAELFETIPKLSLLLFLI